MKEGGILDNNTANISNCAYCGAPLDSSNRISPVLMKCPNCEREIQVQDNVSKDIITKLNLAHVKRQGNFFDEAYDLYEDIIKNNPTYVDGYWGKFLSEYGIVYVFDETSDKYIPTMNRFLEEEISGNTTYQTFMSLVDDTLKDHYLKEANYIERIRQDILYHMKNDDYFDVFICYKKTVQTEKGDLETPESRQARNIREMLKENGYNKVFFAEETLKGSPGANWEALIYTALKTSKVLLLMCSDDEYIRSPWVKNEWSRFYKLTQIDKSKKIIPISVNGYNFNRLPYNMKKFQGLTMQDTTFSFNLMNYLNETVPVSIYDKIKRKEVNVVTDRKIKDRQPVEIVSRRIGLKEVTEYKVTPTIEKELRNINKIYMSRERYGKAIKRYEKLLSNDNIIPRALWGKICATLETNDYTLNNLQFDVNIEKTFTDFETLMKAKSDETQIFLNHYTEYLKRMVSNKRFNDKLFTFILSWKDYEDQLVLSEEVYNNLIEFLRNMDEDGNSFFVNKFVPEVLEKTTDILKEDQNSIYFDRYLTVAEILLSKGYFTQSQKLIKVVTEIDDLNSRALLVQLLIDLKVRDMDSISENIGDKKFEVIFKKLLTSGYDSLAVHKEIFSGAHKLLDQKKYRKATEVFNLYLSYYPETKNEDLEKSIEEFTDKLLINKKYHLAERYANHLLAVDSTSSYAYYVKFKIRIKASSHLDVIVKTKEDLMYYPEFENLLNCQDDNEDVLLLYDIHDRYNEKTKEAKILRKNIKKHYPVYTSYKSTCNLHEFITDVFPHIIENNKEMAKTTREFNKKVSINHLILGFGILYSLLYAFNLPIVYENIVDMSFFSVAVRGIFALMFNSLFFIFIIYIFVTIAITNIKEKKRNVFKLLSDTIVYVIVLALILGVGTYLPIIFNGGELGLLLSKVIIAGIFTVVPSAYAVIRASRIQRDYTELDFSHYIKRYQVIVAIITILTMVAVIFI